LTLDYLSFDLAETFMAPKIYLTLPEKSKVCASKVKLKGTTNRNNSG
jgi:hypothetical protein